MLTVPQVLGAGPEQCFPNFCLSWTLLCGIVCIVYCALYSVPCTLYLVSRRLYIVHYTVMVPLCCWIQDIQ